MKQIQSTAAIATGKENEPRWNGPRTKCGAYTTRRAIGMPYEMYNPMVAMLVAALNATELPKLGRPRMKLSVHASHTSEYYGESSLTAGKRGGTPVRMGDLRLTSTLWKNVCPGIPPSRAKAYIIRLFDVMENVPHQNMEPMTMTWRARK